MVSKIALLLALWPVWLWNFERLTDKSDEPLSLLALIALGCFLWQRRNNTACKGQPISIIALITLALYCVSTLFAPKLIQGTLAVAAMCLILPGSSALSLPGWMLALLSLPVVATLSFYLSYPLRVLIGYIAVASLNMIGYSTKLEGTALLWNSQIVEIDAPCSGIKMLWFAGFLSASLSAYFNLKNLDTFKVCIVAAAAAIAANALRITSLFLLETGTLALPREWHDPLHQGVGVIVFALAASSILFYAHFLYKRSPTTTTSTQPQSQLVEPSTTSSAPKAGFQSHARLHWRHTTLLVLCCVAAILPLIGSHPDSKTEANSDFPGWPSTFEGTQLIPIAETEAQKRFAEEFPGKIKAFTNGKQTILLRWVAHPTRQLHSSSDCYRGLGFSVKWLPMLIDKDGSRWSTFEADKATEQLVIRERITDSKNASWSDVSSWYWAATMQRTHAPWWAATVVVRK